MITNDIGLKIKMAKNLFLLSYDKKYGKIYKRFSRWKNSFLNEFCYILNVDDIWCYECKEFGIFHLTMFDNIDKIYFEHRMRLWKSFDLFWIYTSNSQLDMVETKYYLNTIFGKEFVVKPEYPSDN